MLWKAIESCIDDLASSKEIVINTGPESVIWYLCRELMAKRRTRYRRLIELVERAACASLQNSW